MKPFFIFRFFPFFCQIAKRKVLIFCSQCFAYYTTTRENRELRLGTSDTKTRKHYTTTRENRELRQPMQEQYAPHHYTTTRENRELRQCDYIEEINFHHIVILAAAGSCAREGRIEHKKENTGTVLNMEENLSTGYTQSTTAR